MRLLNWFHTVTSSKRSGGTTRPSFLPQVEQFGGGGTPNRTLLRSFKPEVEPLEERLVMSATGSITTASDWDGAVHEYAITGGAGYPAGTLQEMTSKYYYSTGGFNLFGLNNDSSGFINTPWRTLGGPQLVQISAGTDLDDRAECFGLATNGEVWVYRQYYGWTDLGGYSTQISGGSQGNVYAIGINNTIWKGNPDDQWTRLDVGGDGYGPRYTLQISAGKTSPSGDDVLWAIDGNHYVWSLTSALYSTYSQQSNWSFWGGYATQISGTVHANVYITNQWSGIYFLDFQGNWTFTGGYGSAIRAGTDWTGQYDRVFQIGIGSDHRLYEYSQYGPNAGWQSDGGYVTSIAAVSWAGYGQGGRVMSIGYQGHAWMYTDFATHTGYNPDPAWVYQGGYWLR